MEIEIRPVKKTCLLCKRGEVAEKLIDGVSHGFYCQHCGVKYEHCDNLSKVVVYCSWGEHYVEPEDVAMSDDVSGNICKKCDKRLKNEWLKIK